MRGEGVGGRWRGTCAGDEEEKVLGEPWKANKVGEHIPWQQVTSVGSDRSRCWLHGVWGGHRSSLITARVGGSDEVKAIKRKHRETKEELKDLEENRSSSVFGIVRSSYVKFLNQCDNFFYLMFYFIIFLTYNTTARPSSEPNIPFHVGIEKKRAGSRPVILLGINVFLCPSRKVSTSVLKNVGQNRRKLVYN